MSPFVAAMTLSRTSAAPPNPDDKTGPSPAPASVLEDFMKPPRTPPRAEATSKRDTREGSRFAREMTRIEFGRFYWNDELAEEVREACLDKWKKRPPK